jgi:hypothetical protein
VKNGQGKVQLRNFSLLTVHFSRLKAILLFLLLCISLPASAEPMYISLSELRDAAPNVVMATFKGVLDPNSPIWGGTIFQLEITQVIKGSLQTGLLTVNRGSGAPDLKEGAQVIAFLTKDLEFSWVGERRHFQQDPQADFWDLRGFYDYNAYLVGPSTLTYPGLRDYFVDGKPLTCQYQGALHFFDPATGKTQASAYTFSFRIDEGGKLRMEHDIPLQDFAQKEPEVRLSSGFGADLTAEFNSSISGRRMEVYGQVTSIDPQTGALGCMFWIPEPGILTEKMLLDFMADPKIYHPWYEMKVTLENGQAWTIHYGKEYGRIGYVEGTPWGREEFGEISDEPITFRTGHIRIVTDRDRNDKLGLTSMGTDGSVIQNLMMRPFECNVYLEGDGGQKLYSKARMELVKVNYSKY